MPEEKVVEEQKPEEEAREESPSPEEKGDKREQSIPRGRFDEVLDRAKSAEAELKTLQDAQAKATEDRLLEQEKYKELYEQRSTELAEATARADKVEGMEETLAGMLETQLEAIPEKLRGLIPEALGTQEKLAYIATNAAFLTKASPIDVGSGKRGGSKEEQNTAVLTEAQKEAADLMNVSHENYGKYLPQQEK